MKPTAGVALRMVMNESVFRLNETTIGLLYNDFRISNGSAMRWLYRSMLIEEDRRWQYKDIYYDRFVNQPLFEDDDGDEDMESIQGNDYVPSKPPSKRSLYGPLHHALKVQRQGYEYQDKSRVPQLTTLHAYFQIMRGMGGRDWIETDAQRLFLCIHNTPTRLCTAGSLLLHWSTSSSQAVTGGLLLC
ncbi:hypothetical protein MTO96_045225, partial [Rhipicephalus appendiculatus]